MIDTGILAATLSENLELKVANAFVSSGQASPSFPLLAGFLSELFKYHPPESLDSSLEVAVSNISIDVSIGRVAHRKQIISEVLADCRIIVLSDDKCLVVESNDHLIDLIDPSASIVYRYENQIERLTAAGQSVPIVNPESASLSIFALPTFKDLDEALWKYHQRRAKFSLCPHLKRLWLTDERLRFHAGPEHTMRDSLWMFLRDVLRGDPDVKREQNVDDTNPVDIKVTWKWSRSVALIEIKWLGKSFNLETGRRTKDFSNSRAVDGARQLSDYIQTSIEEDPDLYFEGYLVVFDGRRRGVGDSIEGTLISQQAEYYRDKDISFPHELTSDRHLNLQYRFFLEPNLAS